MDTHKVPASYPGASFSTRVIGSKASWEGSEFVHLEVEPARRMGRGKVSLHESH